MHPVALIGAGFLLGTAGVKALTSETAHKGYVKVVSCALQAKEEGQSIIDEARAEVDDILAEAGYEAAEEAEEAEVVEEIPAEEAPAKPAKKAAKK